MDGNMGYIKSMLHIAVGISILFLELNAFERLLFCIIIVSDGLKELIIIYRDKKIENIKKRGLT